MAERYEFVDTNADVTLYPPGIEIGVEPIAGYAVIIGDPWATRVGRGALVAGVGGVR